MNPRYVVAADGGNSKTDLVLASEDGTVLARALGPGTSPLADGLGRTADHLVELTGEALRRAGLDRGTPLAVASFYLANVDLPDEEAAMHSALLERQVAGEIEVANDTLAVLRAGSATGWGIAVVSGAGINAAGRHPDGRAERFLGLGPISGDWGGSWGVGVSGIAAAVRAGDGRGRSTALRDLVRATFGAEPEEVAVAVHRGEIGASRIRDFGPVVFAAATSGDRVAVELVGRLGDEVASYVDALVRRLDVADAEVEVVLGGGLLQAGNPVLTARVRERVGAVAPRAVLRVLDVSPVAGALVSALERAGAGPSALAAARNALRVVPPDRPGPRL